jgi:hypothetical protein
LNAITELELTDILAIDERPLEPLIHSYTVPADPLSNEDINPYPTESLPGDDESAIADPSCVNSSNWPVYMYLVGDALTKPQSQSKIYFSKLQEAVRKDVERAFGVLQARWAIIGNPCKQWYAEVMIDIIYACIILHNMCVEENGSNIDEDLLNLVHNEPDLPNLDANQRQNLIVNNSNLSPLANLICQIDCLKNSDSHHALRSDLIQHIWNKYGSQ